MKWTRVRAGFYTAGEYSVGRLPHAEWFFEGPGADGVMPLKREAQRECEQAAALRLREHADFIVAWELG